MINIITAAERAARLASHSGPGAGPSQPKPIASFRKKGCATCRPIPVYARQSTEIELNKDHGNPVPSQENTPGSG